MASGAAVPVPPSEVAYYFANRVEADNESQIEASEAVALECHIATLQEELRTSQVREIYWANKVKSFESLWVDWERSLTALKTITAEVLVEIQDEIKNLEHEVTGCCRIINDEIWRKKVGAGLEAEECVLGGESRMSQDQRYTEKLHRLYKRMDRENRVPSLSMDDEADEDSKSGSGTSEDKEILRLITVTDIKDHVTKAFGKLKVNIQASIGPMSKGRNDRLEREPLRARINQVKLRAAVVGGDHSEEVMMVIDKQEEVLLKAAAEWAERLLRSV